MKFNPYPAGTIRHIPKEEYPNLNPEHQQFLELLNTKKELEDKLKEINQLIDEREKILLTKIDEGREFNWCWKWIFKKTNISWKNEMEKLVGKKAVDEIVAKTPANEYPHIGIDGFHPLPEGVTLKSKFKLNLKRK